ncbi:MAG TPA: glycosyltransferase family 25 protein [Rhizobiaceae bacterium]
MLAFYINLDKRTDRRAFMDAQLAGLVIEVERLPATTPETISPEDILPLSLKADDQTLSPPEMAISISHFRAWKRMLDEGHPRVLVLEDDVLVSSRLPAFLEAIEAGNNRIGILRLETRLSEVCLHRRVERGPGGFKLHLPLDFEPGAAGYVISADYAARILRSPKRFSMPIDDVLFSLKSPFRDTSAIRTAVPALVLCRNEKSAEYDVPESILASDAQDSRIMRTEGTLFPKPKGLKKLRREFRRVRSQIALIPAVLAKPFAQRTIVPFADGEVSAPRSGAPQRA